MDPWKYLLLVLLRILVVVLYPSHCLKSGPILGYSAWGRPVGGLESPLDKP